MRPSLARKPASDSSRTCPSVRSQASATAFSFSSVSKHFYRTPLIVLSGRTHHIWTWQYLHLLNILLLRCTLVSFVVKMAWSLQAYMCVLLGLKNDVSLESSSASGSYNLCPSSSSWISETWTEAFDKDIPFSTGCSRDSHSLDSVQLLVSLSLALIYCRKRPL